MSAPRPRGFTLVEIVLAMTLFGVILTGLAGVLFRYMVSARTADGRAAVTATVTEQAGHLLALSYDSLDSRAGCTNQTRPIAYQRCISVSLLSPGWKQVTLVLAPANTAIHPDTVVFQRSKTVGGPIQ